MKVNLSQDNKRLFSPMIPWDFNNPPFDIGEISHGMVDLMKEKNGLGLAYNQTDLEGNYQIFCMRGSPENFVMINPRIVDLSGDPTELEEACLSFNGLVIKKKRYPNCRIRFQGPNGETITKKFTGLTSRVIQHEMEHLKGEAFWNGISRLKLDIALKKAYKKGFNLINVNYKGI